MNEEFEKEKNKQKGTALAIFWMVTYITYN